MRDNYPQKLKDFLDKLALFTDRTERIDALISIAHRIKAPPPEIAQRPFPEENRVPACESEAFVWHRPQQDGTLKFYFAIENPQGVSAKALAAILDENLSGAPLRDVAEVDDGIVYEIFGNELSMGKTMGLTSMVSMVRAAAKAALAASA